MIAPATCRRCGRTHDTAPPATPRAELLMRSLDVAVFMATFDLLRLSRAEVEGFARAAAAEVAAHGDDLEFGGKRCASTFAALARGLAALSFAPGGVVFGGSHWCARHPEAPVRCGSCGATVPSFAAARTDGWIFLGGEPTHCHPCDVAARCRVCDAVATSADQKFCAQHEVAS